MPFLEIQLPTGHRDKVEIANNSILISVLDEICYKRNLNIDNCSLLYNKAKIDLSVKFGQSKLINNSKLELIVSPTSLIDNINLEITLQLPNGVRVTNTFFPRDSLWSVLMKSIKDSKNEYEPMVFGPNTNLVPVFIHLHDQIIGKYCLQNTSLASLGFRSGRVLFRLDLKESSGDDLQIIEDFNKKRAKYSQRIKNKSTPEDSKVDIPIEFATTLANPPHQENTKFAPDFTITKEYECFNDFSPFSTFPSNQKLFDDPPDNQKKEQNIKRSTTLGELLGINFEADETSYIPVNTPNFADFKFPEESAGQNLMESDEKPIENVGMTNAERESVFYYRKPVEQVILDEEIPNNFYDVTEQDFHQIIKSYRQTAESDAPLLTKALKEQMREAKFSKYERCIIQFHFQDAYILQSVFKPKETVGDLYNYVKFYLRNSHGSFHLYTTPPKEILRDKESTLIKTGLVPLSKIYVSVKAAEFCPENLDLIITVDAENKANELLSKWMKTNMNTEATSQSQSDPSLICGTSSSNVPVSKTAKLPKWLNR